MNKLMMTMAATMAFAAFAQEPAPAPGGCPEGTCSVEKADRPGPGPRRMGDRGPRMGGERPMMGGAGMGAGMDPIVRMAMNPRMAEKIGLTDDQKAKLAELRGEKGGPDRELQAKVRDGMKRQVELLKAEKVDEAAVLAAIDEVFEARKEMAKAQTKRMIAVKALLTPEQIEKAREAMKEMGPRGPKGEGRGPRGPKHDKPAEEMK